MAKDVFRGRDRSSLVPESRLEISEAAWALFYTVKQRQKDFPLIARLLADEYEDTEITAEEVSSLKWEAERLAEFVRGPRETSRLSGAEVNSADVLEFLVDLRRLAEAAASRGEAIFAFSD